MWNLCSNHWIVWWYACLSTVVGWIANIFWNKYMPMWFELQSLDLFIERRSTCLKYAASIASTTVYGVQHFLCAIDVTWHAAPYLLVGRIRTAKNLDLSSFHLFRWVWGGLRGSHWKRYGPFYLTTLAVPLVMADLTRHVLQGAPPAVILWSSTYLNQPNEAHGTVGTLHPREWFI